MMVITRRCTNCGSDMQTTARGGKVYCDECRELLKPRKQRADPEPEYRVVFDPIPTDEGGFRPGSRISSKELRNMCRADYRSFLEGTILMDSKGKRYIIRDRSGSNSQAVIAVVEPPQKGLVQGCDATRTNEK